jgi:hypothetical protein
MQGQSVTSRQAGAGIANALAVGRFSIQVINSKSTTITTPAQEEHCGGQSATAEPEGNDSSPSPTPTKSRDLPDTVYYPSHVDGMKMVGMDSANGRSQKILKFCCMGMTKCTNYLQLGVVDSSRGSITYHLSFYFDPGIRARLRKPAVGTTQPAIDESSGDDSAQPRHKIG